MLLAESRRNLQLLCNQVEMWAREYDLKINTSKTEYAIFNGTSTTSTIRLAGETITSNPSSTYLGLAKKNDKYKLHYEKRLSKAKSASFALSKIFYRLPHLAVSTHLNIARACIKAVFLYGSEIGSLEDTKKTTEQMNILLRRQLRHIMRSKISTANETLQLDAGWNRTETEILVKKIRLYAEVNDGDRGTLASEIAKIAMERNTPWFTEI